MGFYTKYQKQADREYQKLAEGQNCLVCGKPADCVHHCVPKSQSNALRYDIKNGAYLCISCHFKHHNGDPWVFATILKRKGQAWFDDLQKRRNEYVKVNKDFYISAIKKLKNINVND